MMETKAGSLEARSLRHLHQVRSVRRLSPIARPRRFSRTFRISPEFGDQPIPIRNLHRERRFGYREQPPCPAGIEAFPLQTFNAGTLCGHTPYADTAFHFS
jgi:hypothetical protein